MSRVGIIAGSLRSKGNGAGVVSWVTSQLQASPLFPQPATQTTIINLGSLALPFFDEDIMPAMITSPENYAHPAVREWSKLVSSLDAIIIVTPQYNWGYPAVLKNSVDCLYNEWKNKPILILSYGGHGGGKSAAQLKQVLEGGVKARLVEKMVGITLQREMITGDVRVHKDWEGLKTYEGEFADALTELKRLMTEPQGLVEHK